MKTSDARIITGASRRQIEHWVKVGLVTPADKGSRHAWSFDELVTLRLVTELRREGATVPNIRRGLAAVRQLGFRLSDPAAELRFALWGGEVLVLRPDERLPQAPLTCVGRRAFELDIVELRQEVRERLRCIGT